MDFNMFSTPWFTLLWGSGSIYYQLCTVSVSYQPYPSFRQKAGEFKLPKLGRRLKVERKQSKDWQNFTLKLRGESSFSA